MSSNHILCYEESNDNTHSGSVDLRWIETDNFLASQLVLVLQQDYYHKDTS